MTELAQLMQAETIELPAKSRWYKAIAVMAAAALTVSTAVILLYEPSTLAQSSASAGQMSLFVNSMLPFMISAVVAALTAIGILSVAPILKAYDPACMILTRLRGLRGGDLSTRLRLRPDHQLRALAGELNLAVIEVGRQVAQLKTINRRQWDVLQDIKTAVAEDDIDQAMLQVRIMENNWERLAEIEESLVT